MQKGCFKHLSAEAYPQLNFKTTGDNLLQTNDTMSR